MAREKKQIQEQRTEVQERRSAGTGVQHGDAGVLASLVTAASTVDLYT